MTMTEADMAVEKRWAAWRFDGTEEIPMDMAIQFPYAVVGDRPDKLLLTGLGERDVAAIAGRLAEEGINQVAVASLVYPSLVGRLDVSVVEQSIIKGTEAVVHEITGNGDGIQQLVGNSGGANQALLAAARNPGLYGQVLAIGPLINGKALGDTPKLQARKLKDRFQEADLSVGDNGGWSKELVTEMRSGLDCFDKQNAEAVLLALDGKLKIYVGEKDPVVPPAETEAVTGTDLVTRVPGMGHPTLLDDAGARQVATVMQAEWTAGIVE